MLNSTNSNVSNKKATKMDENLDTSAPPSVAQSLQLATPTAVTSQDQSHLDQSAMEQQAPPLGGGPAVVGPIEDQLLPATQPLVSPAVALVAAALPTAVDPAAAASPTGPVAVDSPDNNGARPRRAARQAALTGLVQGMQRLDTGQQGEPLRDANGTAARPATPSSTAGDRIPKRRMDQGSEASFQRPAKRGRGGRGRGRGRGAAQQAAALAGHEQGGAHVDVDEEDTTLFGLIRNGRANIRALCDDWIEDYKKSETDVAKLIDLLQLFVSASGCKGVITRHMIETMEYQNIIAKMTDDFDENTAEYPLVMSGAMYRRMKERLGDFVMVDSLIQLLTGMCDSQVRAFRHTATFCAMKLMSALVDVSVDLTEQQVRNQRQLDSEKARMGAANANRGGPSAERLQLLIEKKNEIEEHNEEITAAINYIFKSVFVHRYRDVVADIRCSCIVEVGKWMHVYPDYFLEDSYLKYIGWTLYDKIADVRSKCLDALLRLYENNSLAARMDLFTSKFKDRIVSMVLDRDVDVGVQAIKLFTLIARSFPDTVTGDDCARVYDLVFCMDKRLASAAGEFLNNQLFSDRSPPGTLIDQNGRQKCANEPGVHRLVTFLCENEYHNHAAYLVDALLESNHMLRDWRAMTDWLLEEPGEGMQPLSTEGESRLIDIMTCAVAQTATQDVPSGRTVVRKGPVPQNKDDKKMQADRMAITEHFIATIPRLLQKYVTDREALTNLLQIPLHFDPELYVAGRHDKLLDDLLKCMELIIDRHTDPLIVDAVARIVKHLCEGHTHLEARAATAAAKLIDAVLLRFKQLTQNFQQEEPGDIEDLAALRAAWRRTAAFHKHFDLGKWDVWDTFLTTFAGPHGGDSELRLKAGQCCYLSCWWDMQRIVDDGEVDRKAAIERLSRRRDAYIQAAQSALAAGGVYTAPTLCQLCDVYLLFNPFVSEEAADLKPLAHLIDEGVAAQMQKCLEQEVFGVQDEHLAEGGVYDQTALVERVYERRQMLAAYCKLLVHGALPMSGAQCVFAQYTRAHNDFGDVIKHTMGKLREMSRLEFARTLARTLISSFEQLQSERADAGTDLLFSDEFIALRDLAKRFALVFGTDQLKIREAIATIHREGILYALGEQGLGANVEDPPPSLAFLEVLNEFSGRLMKQDRPAVIKYLDRRVPPTLLSKDADKWQPLLVYRATLEKAHGDDVTSLAGGGAAPSSTGGASVAAAAGRGAATGHSGRGRGRGGRGRPRAVQPPPPVTPSPSDAGE